MDDERHEKLKRYLAWITPGGLESAASDSTLLAGIEQTPDSTEDELERASEAVERVERGEELRAEHVDALEAIVLPNERPVLDVVDGTYARPVPPFVHFGDDPVRTTIEAVIPAVGRVELPDHPSLPYGGTAFVVGDGVLMTNRHVAELFTAGIGRDGLSFRPGLTAAVDLLRERDREASLEFRIARVAMVHPYWDMALLVADGLDAITPLRLSVAAPGDLREREIAVVGYPALDPRNNVEVQNRIFRGTFNVKRLQPGKLREVLEIGSFGHEVAAVTHDSSTLGGNSGSALVDVATGLVVGLHFAGRYLEANYAVPSRELALDRRVVEAGVNFEDEIAVDAPPWSRFWTQVDPPAREGREAGRPAAASIRLEGQALSWSIPLEVAIEIRSPSGAVVGAEPSVLEGLVEPFRDEDFSTRSGYDDRFLGLPVPPPRVLDESILSRLDDGSHLLPYEHFSIALNKDRRLALFTASNVDAAPERKEPEPDRDYTRTGLTGLRENDQEKWFIDPRIPALHQLPDRFFTKDRKAFDKGHIVRREDVAWGGSFDEVRRANGDTFHVTNCSPQVAAFNRSNKKGVWGRLENLILNQAEGERYSLFAGPVFAEDDRIFRGVDDDGPVAVAIPRRFWKIVVARSGDDLQTFAFLLDQDLSGVDFEEFAVDPEWRTRMVSVAHLEQLVRELEFPRELHDSDQIAATGGEAVRAQTGIESLD